MTRTSRSRRSRLPATPSPGHTLQVRQEVHIGPLPAADEFRSYESTLPGVADRIVKLAEGHARDHWRNNRNRRIAALLLPTIAAVVGLLIALSLIGGGVWLVANGHPLSGLGAIAAPAAGVAIALVRAASTWSRTN